MGNEPRIRAVLPDGGPRIDGGNVGFDAPPAAPDTKSKLPDPAPEPPKDEAED